MNPDTIRQWMAKADHDLKIGKGELNSQEPATDMICFHMQQCVEKYLKAYCIFRDLEITKTHDITIILKDCLSADASFSVLLEKNIEMLTPYGTIIRYADDFYMPTIEETREAVAMAEMVRNFVQEKLSVAGFDCDKNEK